MELYIAQKLSPLPLFNVFALYVMYCEYGIEGGGAYSIVCTQSTQKVRC